ncbi:AGCS family alanine or glycine:cation symporter [Rhodovulum sulfidophilum]|uniref:alanine/glycine:cation symporter family protein n=1 Tax=Rhodovulum sulfidophilum TaxID=35806 RepID=UPI0005A82141|nr:sodium:alanine symporter family protein [Rhodovulum sulfidophilum]ANB35642.1 sodium:alanine symporter [Rhodovulum sulfidophilum DSM 1374]ANB39464.1 sodium:alanine symporter [Rhodovulum sulfidophilum]MCW2302744.1 AGCS family alanine or glycine:cation symporter [Rhodovulum sulfidophilum]
MTDFLNAVSSFVWGAPVLVLLLGTGLYLCIGLRFLPQRKLGYGIRMMLEGRKKGEGHEGEITPFQALTTALSATIGTGNIAGVATAIFLGGPGAVFWMWLTALVGMATKYAEAVLAVHYREVDAKGRYVGGPMYYIKNGLGPRFAWLAWMFAFFATIAAFGIGNTVQANSVADAVETTFGVPHLWTGIALAALTFVVIVGGVKRIGAVAEWLVPLMAVLYIIGALTILALNFQQVPGAIALIFDSAFNGAAATGGFAGAAVMAAIRFGVARGIFSNEAGLGSAPIAHAAALTDDPVRQGNVAMLGTFIDTILVCSMTALVIITTGVWSSGETGAALSALAFNTGLPGGDLIVSFGLIVFAFTTILGWSYYGERAAEYLFGPKVILPFRLLWVAGILIGAVANLGVIWIVADIMNALMAIPNLIALIALSGTVFAVSRAYWRKQAE